MTENKYLLLGLQIKRQIELEKKINIIVEYRKTQSAGGVAYYSTNTVKSPIPLNPRTLALYLHELGHIYTGNIKPSCYAEYKAEMFSVEILKKYGVKINRKMKNQHNYYMAYSLAQALNRKMKRENIPVELLKYKKYIKRIPCIGAGGRVVGYTHRASV